MAIDRTATPAKRVERVTREISGVKSQYGITSWEETFLSSVSTRAALTPLQETHLRTIEVKVFGDEADDEHTKDLFA